MYISLLISLFWLLLLLLLFSICLFCGVYHVFARDKSFTERFQESLVVSCTHIHILIHKLNSGCYNKQFAFFPRFRTFFCCCCCCASNILEPTVQWTLMQRTLLPMMIFELLQFKIMKLNFRNNDSWQSFNNIFHINIRDEYTRY